MAPHTSLRRQNTVTTVAVLANDPDARRGLTAYLRAHPGIDVLDDDDTVHADVVLIVAGALTEEALSSMRHATFTTTNRGMRIVLVADRVCEEQLPRAVGYGLVAIVPVGADPQAHDPDARYDRIARAVLGSRAWPHDVVLIWLTAHVKALLCLPSACLAA